MSKLDNNFDIDVCIISAYWHDVGRTIDNENHEKISAEFLKQEMEKLDYDNKMIDKCYNEIVNHRWNMNLTTIEGLILNDADKLHNLLSDYDLFKEKGSDALKTLDTTYEINQWFYLKFKKFLMKD